MAQNCSSEPHPEWLTYREAMAEFGLKKGALYGRLSKLVRVRNVPGDTMKWSRTDLERLTREFTRSPAAPAVRTQTTGRPRSPGRKPTTTLAAQATFEYLR